MADKKITGLDPLAAAAAADVLPIVDVSDLTQATSGTTKHIRADALFANPQPLGSSTPDTGRFTTLQLGAGQIIDELSTDGTLAGDSDTAVPTEKAVKAYVDAAGGQTDRIITPSGDTSVVVNDITGTTFYDGTSVIATVTAGGLQLETGPRINEISSDTNLGASDTAVPTENAVKSYVDNAISNLNPNKIWQDDSYVEVVDDGTNAGHIKIVADGSEVVNVSDFSQIFGKADSSHLSISDGTTAIVAGTFEAFGIKDAGINVEFGASINEFSTDGTLAGNSDTALPTEQAVKTYVDAQISSSSLNVFSTVSDTTASDGDAILVDTTGGDVDIEMLPTANAKIIIKKTTTDSNVVNITTLGGLVDNQASYVIDSINEAYTLICDGINYYVI